MKKHPSRHAHLLETKAFLAWSAALVAAFVLVGFYAKAVLPSGQMAAVITSTLVRLTNEDRADANLGELTINPLLVAAAQAKANDMAAKGYFAHTSPDGSTSWSWFRDVGYSFSSAGENLAVDFTDSVDVENAWMNSPTHRANIMNRRFTEVGIATAVGEYQGRKTVFVVQMFGTPAAPTDSQAEIREIVPVEATEPAIAIAEEGTNVLGSETDEKPEDGEAVAAVVPEATPTIVVPFGPAPESLIEVVPETVTSASALAVSPKTLLRSIYILAAVVLLVLVGLVTRFELRRHHMPHVAMACLLIVFMSGLFFTADRLLFPTTVVGQEIIP